jgi:protein SCO1/2
MGREEKHFQTIDVPAAPGFELAGCRWQSGQALGFSDKVVVLNFVFASCTDVCPLRPG